MAMKTTHRAVCCQCRKTKGTLICDECSKGFCPKHMIEHVDDLREQLNKTDDEFSQFKLQIEEQLVKPEAHELMKEIDNWERESIEKIQKMANDIRQELSSCLISFVDDLNAKFRHLTEQFIQCRTEGNIIDSNIQFFNEELNLLKNTLHKPPFFKIQYKSRIFIKRIRLTKNTPFLRSLTLNTNTRWKKNGVIVAGGNGRGDAMSQLSQPWGLYVDDDQTVYIADCGNNRIVQYKCGSKTGRIMAGGNEVGCCPDQLISPKDVIIDKDRDNLIICDTINKRIVRWPRRNGKNGETIISNVGCCGLTIDDNGSLYIVDLMKHEVKQYCMGEDEGIVVAGGNGQGNRLDQLNSPTYAFVDRDHSVYVADHNNHRVMKWMKGAKQGLVVAGGQGEGNSLAQLSNPYGIFVDPSDSIYVVDCSNDRIMCWHQGATQGSVIAGGNGHGNRSNQLSSPVGLSFDREGNLYVSENGNQRVQKFNIDQS
ncbi:unnamed protein product [Rotaria socialis]|uniref:Uncharacterized protein n=4 Tax=Rotaria socialis TaxID=392032 RepID=A0A820MPL9_9BILA|nr:unnamed protein product [Rotaria socialis]CAF4375849.1 unnamed protein product [Rotaria socialis]